MTDPDLDVRDALHRLAAGAGRPRGEDTAAAAVALSRRQRRTRLALAGGAVAVALLAGAVPALLPDAGPAAGGAATGGTGQAEDAGPGLYDLPVRGSLAGDDDFVAGAAALEWSAPLGIEGAVLSPPAPTRRVLFAGDLPGGRRWALVMGEDRRQLVYAWFGGPAGAAPDELALLAPPQRGGQDQPMALLDTAGPAPVLVVVSRPADTARYSPGSVPVDGGGVGRAWTDLTEADGVLVAEVPAPVYLGVEAVDVRRDGATRTTVRPVPLTDASAPPPVDPRATVADALATTDPEVRERLAACLLPQGFVLTVRADGGYEYGYPVVEGGAGDEEVAVAHAAYDAVLAACAEQVTGGPAVPD
ncbi:hypothetical protein JOD57_003434 [Geodermatophilus bullaregiensis]|uniref:hypothetical protein n=1 Tax=Geodermatophilus bullaregiensis TaxID=1564160 RepID=UPI00195DBE2D|nr:hypothetical protein [Geodermatophilus bullaregiensis]MBM7807597.1 hypothetical protein [Geodermatophilus bullaregiensis]